jgi:hypothetical protein
MYFKNLKKICLKNLKNVFQKFKKNYLKNVFQKFKKMYFKNLLNPVPENLNFLFVVRIIFYPKSTVLNYVISNYFLSRM